LYSYVDITVLKAFIIAQNEGIIESKYLGI